VTVAISLLAHLSQNSMLGDHLSPDLLTFHTKGVIGEIIMKLKVTALFAIAAATFFMASSVHAECKLSANDKSKSGIIVDNDLVRFNTNLNGEVQYARTFDDTKWAGKALTVEASSKCDAIVYHGSGAHTRVKRGTSGAVPSDARGVGCDCR